MELNKIEKIIKHLIDNDCYHIQSIDGGVVLNMDNVQIVINSSNKYIEINYTKENKNINMYVCEKMDKGELANLGWLISYIVQKENQRNLNKINESHVKPSNENKDLGYIFQEELINILKTGMVSSEFSLIEKKKSDLFHGGEMGIKNDKFHRYVCKFSVGDLLDLEKKKNDSNISDTYIGKFEVVNLSRTGLRSTICIDKNSFKSCDFNVFFNRKKEENKTLNIEDAFKIFKDIGKNNKLIQMMILEDKVSEVNIKSGYKKNNI